jgi:hypothetical protein
MPSLYALGELQRGGLRLYRLGGLFGRLRTIRVLRGRGGVGLRGLLGKGVGRASLLPIWGQLVLNIELECRRRIEGQRRGESVKTDFRI